MQSDLVNVTSLYGVGWKEVESRYGPFWSGRQLLVGESKLSTMTYVPDATTLTRFYHNW